MFVPQVHGFPRVIGVLTHLDSYRNPTTLRRVKKQMKQRFWTGALRLGGRRGARVCMGSTLPWLRCHSRVGATSAPRAVVSTPMHGSARVHFACARASAAPQARAADCPALSLVAAADIYEGCKLFYLSGLKHGRYPKVEVTNLARFIAVLKFRPLIWRNSHPSVVVSAGHARRRPLTALANVPLCMLLRRRPSASPSSAAPLPQPPAAKPTLCPLHA